ncbi:MAG: glycosyltransferase family 2 protein [Candidatus Omnitrophica bacterium]|nr:glycosyltransferase family 2 protein [Candidatus Omnitrophota bacterium]
MGTHKQTIVIIPAFNEENAIGNVISKTKNTLENTDIVVVDDGSSDNTVNVARENGAGVLSLGINAGYGVALQTGYKYAYENGYDYILQIDGDGQHEPRFLKNILDELKTGKNEVVIGSRYLSVPRYGSGLLRKIGMRFFAFLASVSVRHKITDPTSGFVGFRREVLPILISDYFPVDYPDADVIIMLKRCGFSLKEIPVVMYPGSAKSMHRGIRPVYYIFKMLLSILVTLLRDYGKKSGRGL